MTPTEVSRQWDFPDTAIVKSLPGGLINQTFAVLDASGATIAILQQLNTRIFRAVVHEDIDAVTRHLTAKGLATPSLIRTRSGDLWFEDDAGQVWRCQTPVGDRSIDKLVDPADAAAAGGLVARFHAATRDLSWSFRMVRPGAHDTEAHFETLTKALATHREHRLFDEVAALADTLRALWAAWDGPGGLPTRVIHGDLKVSNIRFQGKEALALIDLDTLARSTLDVELGDALRSWCNPAAEDADAPRFDLAIFEAALRGYAASAVGVSDVEWSGIVPGLSRITTELAARFAADALNESYFGWDASFGTRGRHNLVRACNQATLARDIAKQRLSAERIIAACARQSA